MLAYSVIEARSVRLYDIIFFLHYPVLVTQIEKYQDYDDIEDEVKTVYDITFIHTGDGYEHMLSHVDANSNIGLISRLQAV